MIDLAELKGTVGVVTGASGFLGRAVLSVLPEGTVVHGVFSTDDEFPDWASTRRADVRPLRLDLRRDRLASRIAQVDWALLLASRVETSASRQDPVGELEAVAGVAANSVMGLRTNHLVHVSSGSVYEGLSGDLSPARVLRPRLPYSIAKLAAELLVESYAESPYWNLRFFGAYGPGEPSFKLARRLVERFAAGDTEFVLTGNGDNRIDPMYIDDAARAIGSFLRVPGESRTIDLCQGEAPTVAEFARLAFASAHPRPDTAEPTLIFEGDAHEQIVGRANPAAQEAVAAVSRMTLEEGFAEYAQRMRSRQPPP